MLFNFIYKQIVMKSYSQLLQLKEKQERSMVFSGLMIVLFFIAAGISWVFWGGEKLSSLLLWFALLSFFCLVFSPLIYRPYPEIDNIENAMIKKFGRKTFESMIEIFSSRELDIIADDVMKKEFLESKEEEQEIKENLKKISNDYQFHMMPKHL